MSPKVPGSVRSQLNHDHPALLQGIEFEGSKRLLQGQETCPATLGSTYFKPDAGCWGADKEQIA